MATSEFFSIDQARAQLHRLDHFPPGSGLVTRDQLGEALVLAAGAREALPGRHIPPYLYYWRQVSTASREVVRENPSAFPGHSRNQRTPVSPEAAELIFQRLYQKSAGSGRSSRNLREAGLDRRDVYLQAFSLLFPGKELPLEEIVGASQPLTPQFEQVRREGAAALSDSKDSRVSRAVHPWRLGSESDIENIPQDANEIYLYLDVTKITPDFLSKIKTRCPNMKTLLLSSTWSVMHGKKMKELAEFARPLNMEVKPYKYADKMGDRKELYAKRFQVPDDYKGTFEQLVLVNFLPAVIYDRRRRGISIIDIVRELGISFTTIIKLTRQVEEFLEGDERITNLFQRRLDRQKANIRLTDKKPETAAKRDLNMESKEKIRKLLDALPDKEDRLSALLINSPLAYQAITIYLGEEETLRSVGRKMVDSRHPQGIKRQRVHQLIKKALDELTRQNVAADENIIL